MGIGRYFILLLWTGMVAADAPDALLPLTAEHVGDGDSFSVSARLYGVDAPEWKQQCMTALGVCYPCGQHAKNFLKKETKRKQLYCVSHGLDSHGRALLQCHTSKQSKSDLGLRIIASGWALAYRHFLKGTLRDLYIQAEDKAKREKRGIWQGNFEVPYRWRRSKRHICPDYQSR